MNVDGRPPRKRGRSEKMSLRVPLLELPEPGAMPCGSAAGTAEAVVAAAGQVGALSLDGRKEKKAKRACSGSFAFGAASPPADTTMSASASASTPTKRVGVAEVETMVGASNDFASASDGSGGGRGDGVKLISARTFAAVSAAAAAVTPASAPMRRVSLPAPESLLPDRAPRCLVLDNDECTGSYQLGSLLFNMYLTLCATTPDPQLFIDRPKPNIRYLERGGARPGLKALLVKAAKLKTEKRLDHVILFTAASNKGGWVTFLKDCLERFAGVPPGTISRVITLEHTTARHMPSGRPIKDLRLICSDPSNVVMVDDKPEFVTHGKVLSVSEYNQHIPIDDLIYSMPCSEAHRQVARDVLKDDLEKHPPSRFDQAGDREMFTVIEHLDRIFPRLAPAVRKDPPARRLTIPTGAVKTED